MVLLSVVPSSAEWMSLILRLKKKNGEQWVVVEYQKFEPGIAEKKALG